MSPTPDLCGGLHLSFILKSSHSLILSFSHSLLLSFSHRFPIRQLHQHQSQPAGKQKTSKQGQGCILDKGANGNGYAHGQGHGHEVVDGGPDAGNVAEWLHGQGTEVAEDESQGQKLGKEKGDQHAYSRIGGVEEKDQVQEGGKKGHRQKDAHQPQHAQALHQEAVQQGGKADGKGQAPKDVGKGIHQAILLLKDLLGSAQVGDEGALHRAGNQGEYDCVFLAKKRPDAVGKHRPGGSLAVFARGRVSGCRSPNQIRAVPMNSS
jgi:hypothetical protein